MPVEEPSTASTSDIGRRRRHGSSVPTAAIAAVRRTGFMECPAATPTHSGLMFAARITLPHFSVSSAMNLPKSAGEPESTVPPRSAIRALILGSARPALISLLSLSTISTGVFLRRADAEPCAGLVARHEFAHSREVRQRLRARRGRHRQRAQLAGPDVLDRRGMGSK